MAVWRTKAYEEFGFLPGSYSHARGKVDLFADLVEMAKKAAQRDNDDLLGRIVRYVTWADEQASDELASALDLAFFLPLLREQSTFSEHVERLIPAELMAAKRQLLRDRRDWSGSK